MRTGERAGRYGFAAMIAVLCFLFGQSQLHRTAGSVVATDLTVEFGLSGAALGSILGTLFLGAVVAQIPVGLLYDRYGARAVTPLCTLIAVLGSVVFAVARDETMFAVGRFLIGIGFAAAWTGAFFVLSGWARGPRYSRMVSIVASTGVFFGLLGTAPLAYAFAHIGRETTFLLLAALALIGAVLSHVFIRDRPPGVPAVTGAPETLRESLLGMAEVLRHPALPRLAPLAFVAFTPMMMYVGSWAGPYLRDVHGLDATERGQFLLLMTLGTNLGLATYGPVERYFGSPKGLVVASGMVVVAMAVGLVGFAGASLWTAGPFLVLVATFGPFYIVFLVHCRTLFPDHLTGRALSVINLLGILGTTTLQPVLGAVIGSFIDANGIAGPDGYRYAFGLQAALLFVALLIYLRLDDATAKAPPAPGDRS